MWSPFTEQKGLMTRYRGVNRKHASAESEIWNLAFKHHRKIWNLTRLRLVRFQIFLWCLSQIPLSAEACLHYYIAKGETHPDYWLKRTQIIDYNSSLLKTLHWHGWKFIALWKDSPPFTFHYMLSIEENATNTTSGWPKSGTLAVWSLSGRAAVAAEFKFEFHSGFSCRRDGWTFKRGEKTGLFRYCRSLQWLLKCWGGEG